MDLASDARQRATPLAMRAGDAESRGDFETARKLHGEAAEILREAADQVADSTERSYLLLLAASQCYHGGGPLQERAFADLLDSVRWLIDSVTALERRLDEEDEYQREQSELSR